MGYARELAELATAYNTGSPLTHRNKIINGAMVIDQRNAGASVSPVGGVNTYTLDRWGAYCGLSSKLTIQQNAGSVTPPAGFTNYIGVTSSSAYSVSSGDIFELYQGIEGYNVADLDFGKSTAKTFTISFWVRSSLTGSFGASFENGALNRSYPFSYTINSANTWEQKSVTIAGDTTGTWATGNTTGGFVIFSLGAGSTFSGTANTWQAGNISQPTGSVSLVGTSGATLYITGVQLEAGRVATPFEMRQYGTELALCQRYYAKTYNIETTPGTATYNGSITARVAATEAYSYAGYFTFPVSMRAQPTITIYSPGDGATGQAANNSAGNFSANLTQPSGTAGVNIQANGVSLSSVTSNYSHVVASAEL